MHAPRALTPRLLAALTALLLLTTACSGDDGGNDDDAAADDAADDTDDTGADDTGADDTGAGDTDRAELPDPCKLVTTTDLEGFFGFAWDEGELSEQPATGSNHCTWTDADPAPPVAVVSLVVATDDSLEEAFGQSAKSIFELTRAATEEGGTILEPDLGLGDDSYRSASGIYLLDGDTAYTVVTVGGTSDEAVAGLKAMAAHIVGG